ncbi:HD domain-containing protein [Allokutzneria sp. A3M-2-11 16]|uniref:HD domain-containing protein n=1 Tax=Allokutzneria sp. A3M-2-11 16 TaxID=2962043 RepID=UPI0020B80967|nr:HD domain-containing protein [Allokutzneria sp. A3M-2-11 16]MCP3804593.1 HD domain-containing protein [Allokutzneria sp. A3M-2-11 16]
MDQFPQTDLALGATRFARRLEEPAVFNHSMRTYLYGRFLGERKGLRAGLDYDDELLFLGCVLHDIGLSEEGNGDQRFDIDGADLAARFLTEQGVAADRVEVVWDAIALHLCFEVAQRKRPEIALVTLGAGYDLGPNPEHPLPEGYAERVHAELPRLHGAAALHKAIVDQALAKPQKAPPFTMPGELVRQVTGQQWPTWQQLMSREPSWNDHEGWQG